MSTVSRATRAALPGLRTSSSSSSSLPATVASIAKRSLATHSDVATPSPATAPIPAPLLLEDLPEFKSRKTDPSALRRLPQFTISRSRGFLPRDDPVHDMPAAFSGLDSLLKRMTVLQPPSVEGGERKLGLLGTGDFGAAIHDELRPDGPEAKGVEQAIASGDSRLISALFRDYCFAASAYLLEPVDISYRKTGLYSEGRRSLPAQIAVPLKKLADALGHFPFMEYASSYALVNWRAKSDDHKGFAGRLSFDNIELIRAFQDAYGSEAGFILVHVEMVSFSGRLVAATEDAMAAAERGDSNAFEGHMEQMLDAYRHIQASMETMWKRSKPDDYMKLRSFIFGTGPKAGNPMFPDGVVYEGVSDEPLHFRGESGANDNLVPLGDNFLEITAHHPDNLLTRTLRDFRSYRPKTQREYIDLLEHRAHSLGIRNLAMKGSPRARAMYILLVDQIREFRDRHWRFAKGYIISKTKFPLATGGSPMVAYLPQNLRTVLTVLDQSVAEWSSEDDVALRATPEGRSTADAVRDVIDSTRHQRKQLQDEVEALQKERAGDVRGGMLDKHLADASSYATPMRTAAPHPHAAKADLGEEKILQRGSVGSDGVG